MKCPKSHSILFRHAMAETPKLIYVRLFEFIRQIALFAGKFWVELYALFNAIVIIAHTPSCNLNQ